MKTRVNNAGSERVDSEITKSKTTKKHTKFEKRSSTAKLVKFEALPDYMQDNEYIRDYYRCEWPLKDIALSVFSWHNETLNIWTHFIGFAIFGGLLAVSLMEKETVENLMLRFSFIRPLMEGQFIMMLMKETNGSHELNEVPRWPWFVFLGGAISCLVFSTLSHIFACHSKRYNFFFWRLDYSGISLMIVCSFVPPVYYTFSCHPQWRLFYLTTIILVGICSVFTLISPVLATRQFRSFRAKLFLTMGFSGVIPAAHAVVLHLDRPEILGALGYEIVMGILYGVGATFYLTRVPEKWKPGAFDVVGHSHQIFHVFVVAAALFHCVATLAIMDWRRGFPACSSRR